MSNYSKKKISVLKSRFANLYSITNALDFLGFDYLVSDQAKELLDTDYLIFPGVGSFQAVKKELEQKNLVLLIKEFLAAKNKRFLGICLGMQLLFEESEEGGQSTKGLEIFRGKVCSLDANRAEFIPHIGWNSLYLNQKSDQKEREADFYFVHSLFCDARDRLDIVAYTEPGKDYRVPAFVRKETEQNTLIYGVQFHPEKSGQNGLKLLKELLKA